MMQIDQSNLYNYMSLVPSHNNDLSIPEGVTFVGSINVPGVAQKNGDITGEITCKELEVGPRSGSAKLNRPDKCIIGVFRYGKGAGAGGHHEQIIWAANPPRV